LPLYHSCPVINSPEINAVDKLTSLLYSSPNIIRVITSRRMRWAGLVARIGERRGASGFFVEKNLSERDHLENLDVDGRITLK
jgi:hypothetical protein